MLSYCLRAPQICGPTVSSLPENLGLKYVSGRRLRVVSLQRRQYSCLIRPTTTGYIHLRRTRSKTPSRGIIQADSRCEISQSPIYKARPVPAHILYKHSSSSQAHHQPEPSIPQTDQPPLLSTTTTRPPYTPPRTGFLSHLPASWVPYAELIRLDKPTGTYYLFFPCLFSTLLAAPYTSPTITPPTTVLTITLLFLTGALIMRGAGCTINDLWDRNLDPHVTRTRLRPLARRAITPTNALLFTGAQLLTGLVVLLQFPPQCLPYAVPSLVLVATYPLAKRVTHYPQFVLGLTFSWGAFMGFPALGIDLLAPENAHLALAAASLYASCVSWTVLYDMIYAHMDIRDDAGAGIKSIALRHEKHTKRVLTGLAVVQVGLLGAAGAAVGAGPVFFLGSCGGAVGTLGWMVWRVRLGDVRDCWWWFTRGCWFTGGAVALGLLGEYVARLKGWYGDEKIHDGLVVETVHKHGVRRSG